MNNERVVIADGNELPKGAHFILWPATELTPGSLALIELQTGAQIIGRWYPNVAGSDWIARPKLVIQCVNPVRVLGAVVLVEDPPRPITNLPESEYEHLFENPFPDTLN